MVRQNFKILVVDDTEDIRELLYLRLVADGYDCVLAKDGEEGLQLAREAQPDLILLDLMMPGLDGYEVCRQLKASPLTRRIPVIFLSARSEIVDRVQGLSLGAVDYISKPFDARELRARIEVALRTKQALDTLEQANRELHAFSVTDPLTGLYNRRYLEQQLAQELNDPRRDGVAAACLLLDLDHFKQINDTWGHLAGDEIIRQFGCLIREHTRKGDVVARFGGDEFAVLMTGLTPHGARCAAEKIRARVEEATFVADGTPLKLTTSIGATCFTLGRRVPLVDILQEADRALYQAKAIRNTVVLSEARVADHQVVES